MQRSFMRPPNLRKFIGHLAVVPNHRELFGHAASEAELIDVIKRYPVGEWLSFLARIQNMLGAHRASDRERIHRVICGTMSASILEKLRELERRLPNRCTLRLYYERQLSTLQQLAVLHAPEEGTSTFENENGRHDLSMALLMTKDRMDSERVESGTLKCILPATIQDLIRMSTTPGPQYAARAFYFYEIARETRSDALRTYLKLFETATGTNAVDCIMGGLAHLIREDTQELDQIAECWRAVARSQQCENPQEARILAAYETVRLKSLDELRCLIRKRDGNHSIRDWNLIALSEGPICDLGRKGAFVLNHTALGRSLFDSVRHAILTAALDRRLAAPFADEMAVGGLYGTVFQSYVAGVLEAAFPGRVRRIPETHVEQTADLIIWYPDRVVVVEVKSAHFVGLKHASYMSLERRREKLSKTGIPNAINQLASTIRAVRSGRLQLPGAARFDWTLHPIVPVIVTEEPMPLAPGCWETLYGPIANELAELAGGGPIGRLRFMTVDDVESLPDLEGSADFGRMLLNWGANPDYYELGWAAFLRSEQEMWRGRFIRDRFLDVMKFLARWLGLDDSRIVCENH